MIRSHFYLALAGGAAALVIATLIGFFTVRELRAMSTGLGQANARLTALEQMNHKLDRLVDMDRKLDRLSDMDSKLASVDAKLTLTNAGLTATNVRLASTNANLQAMRTQIVKLAAIRSDIHTMSHKIAGSFLFRAVR